EELRHADARVARRARFPRPDRSGAGALHRAAAPRHSVKAPLLPRRRTLGAEAAELQTLVPDRGGLVRSVLEVGSSGQRAAGRVAISLSAARCPLSATRESPPREWRCRL